VTFGEKKGGRVAWAEKRRKQTRGRGFAGKEGSVDSRTPLKLAEGKKGNIGRENLFGGFPLVGAGCPGVHAR